jgi:hypothetical protein
LLRKHTPHEVECTSSCIYPPPNGKSRVWDQKRAVDLATNAATQTTHITGQPTLVSVHADNQPIMESRILPAVDIDRSTDDGESEVQAEIQRSRETAPVATTSMESISQPKEPSLPATDTIRAPSAMTSTLATETDTTQSTSGDSKGGILKVKIIPRKHECVEYDEGCAPEKWPVIAT